MAKSIAKPLSVLLTKKPRGFTLLEVMVALAIFAVAAIAVTKIGMNYTQSIGQMNDRTFAHFVAMNELAELEINGAWPEGTGEKTVDEQGQRWLVSHQVYNTISESVRRIEIRVAPLGDQDQGQQPAPVTSIVAFLQRPVASSQN
ncbi:type II secretion system minor pseudopilin GspI [Alkanindiges illinoisensis]|uniref:type II secretion system minor pseudopilin GspI n=1 Tax=Alkanindiges illinoisensis TaxID=197183 RepID=UPI0006850BA7|nr:type II secretion system minor pseudopilin GspI [Alkanindiges illinoisensis]